MTISSTRYVDITTGVVGASAVAERELIGLRFTTSPLVSLGDVITVENIDDVINMFGRNSAEHKFAVTYFGYTSPNSTRARRLRFAPWAKTGRTAAIFGAKISASLDTLKAVMAGEIKINLGGELKTASGINLSLATSFADVASTVQTALQAVISASTVTYDAIKQAYNFDSLDFAPSISVEQTDLSRLLGWSTGAILSNGGMKQTPAEAMSATAQVTDSFGSWSFPEALSLEETIEAALYNASRNQDFQFYASCKLEDYEAFGAALINTPYVGLIVNGTDGEFKEALPAAVMAATNFNAPNATVNYMYRQAPGLTADVSDNSLANLLSALRVNFYGVTAQAGQKISFFQDGVLGGGATAPTVMNVCTEGQWLKAQCASRLLSLQLSTRGLSAGRDGESAVAGVVTGVANLGVTNKSILVGKKLTDIQVKAVLDIGGEVALRAINSIGYWIGTRTVQETQANGVTLYTIEYTLLYSKNDMVNKIVGYHSLV